MSNTQIIAEIANAHEGLMENMHHLINVAAAAKVDYIKFQLYRAKELVGPDHPKYQEYHRKEFSLEEWCELADTCRSKQLKIVTEIFDDPSVDIVRAMNVDVVKVHSTSISDIALLKRIAGLGKTVLLSVGGSHKAEVDKALETLHGAGRDDIVLMQGFQNFPTALEDIHLNKIDSLREAYDLPVGVQDHVDGESIFARIVPLMAVAKGAQYIEKHFTLDRSLKGSDYYSSLNPDELAEFVELVRQGETALGSGSFELGEQELKYRNLLKKSLYLATDIAKGESLKMEHICFRRSLRDDRVLIDQLDNVLGKTLTRAVEEGERLTLDMLG